MGVSENGGFPPKSSILTGISIIFTIHFAGFPPIFGNTHRSTDHCSSLRLPGSPETKKATAQLQACAFKRWRNVGNGDEFKRPSTFPSTFFLKNSHLKRYQSKRRTNHVPSISFARFISETHILKMEQTITNHILDRY